MSRSKYIIIAFMSLLGACSGSGGNAGYDYAKIRKMAIESHESSISLIGHDEFVLMPKEGLGDSQRLIIYPEGISNYKAAIFQLSLADLPGVDPKLQAMRHGAGSFLGEKYVGVWNDNKLSKLYPISIETVLPVSKPIISRDFLPELAILSVTDGHPVAGLRISDPALEAHAQLTQYMSLQTQDDSLLSELEDLEEIFEQTPLMSLHDRRSDIGLSEQLLLLIWDDGYTNPAFSSVDPQYSQIILASNFSDQPQLISLPDTREIRLHPGQTNGSDSRVRQTQIALEGVIIPAKTSAVLVRSDKAQ